MATRVVLLPFAENVSSEHVITSAGGIVPKSEAALLEYKANYDEWVTQLTAHGFSTDPSVLKKHPDSKVRKLKTLVQ